MNLNNLSGRDLDAMVAQHVFGLLIEARTNTHTGKKDYVCALRPEGPDPQWVCVAFYTGTMSASITLEVELQNRGWKRIASNWNQPGELGVVLEHTDGQRVEAVGPFKEALCRAALKAVE